MAKYNKFAIEYPFVLLICGAVLTVLTALIGGYLLKLDAFQSTILGMATFVVLAILQMSVYVLEQISEVRKLINRTERLEAILSVANCMMNLDLEPDIKKSTLELIKHIDITIGTLDVGRESTESRINEIFKDEVQREIRQSKDLIDQIRSGSLRVVGDDRHELWEKVILSSQKSFFTTNIFRFRDTLLGSRAEQHLLDLQKYAVTRLGKDGFERLFIYEKPDEVIVKEIINKQKMIGINAWGMERSKFDEISNNRNWVQRIGSEDFSIIDSQFLYLTTVDIPTNRVAYVELHRSGVHLSAALDFVKKLRTFNELYRKDEKN